MAVNILSLFIFSVIFTCICSGTTFTSPPSCDNLLHMSITDGLGFLFVGEMANLTCSINTQSVSDFSLKKFFFEVRKNNTKIKLPSEVKTNSTHMEISTSDMIEYIPNQTFYDYNCVYQTSEEPGCLEREIVYWEFHPSPGKDFKCLVKNWHDMTCWLDLGVKYTDRYTNISAWKRETWTQNAYMLPAGSLMIKDTCLQITFPDSYFQSGIYHLEVHITNTARNISDVTQYTFDTLTYVKPDPIINLSKKKNSTVIDLAWSHSNTQMPKKFRIQYRSEYDDANHWKIEEHIQILEKSLTDTSGYSQVLTNLTPFTKYDVRIDVRPLFENRTETGFWSNTVDDKIQTSEDVPRAVPEMWPGSFSKVDDEVEIFWKPISDRDKCGIIQNYRFTLRVVDDFRTSPELVDPKDKKNATIEETFSADKISHKFKLESEDRYIVKLTQGTSVGYPTKDDAQMYLYPKEYRPKLSKKFHVDAINVSTVMITWGPATVNTSIAEMKEISVYLLVWCNGTINGRCMEPIQTKLIPYHKPEMVNDTLTLDKGYYWNYIFGISPVAGTNQGLFIGGGIRWYEDCVHLLGGLPNKPMEVDIPLDVGQKDGLYIKWTLYSCRESVGEVTDYIINSCVADDLRHECQEKGNNITVSSTTSSYRLKNLTEGKKYLIKIAPVMRDGQVGKWSASKTVLFAGSSSEKIVTEKKSMLLGAVIGGVSAVVLIIAGVVVLTCRKCRKMNENARKIQLPNIQSNADRQVLGETSYNRESQVPLLGINHSANDSGLGTGNGNGTVPYDSTGIQNGGVKMNGYSGYRNKPLPPIITDTHSNNKLNSHGVSTNSSAPISETTFTYSQETSGDSTSHSGYRDVKMISSDEESSEDESSHIQSSGCNSYNPDKLKVTLKNSLNNSSHEEGSHIDSYCLQDESSSPVDSYCGVQQDSNSGVNNT